LRPSAVDRAGRARRHAARPLADPPAQRGDVPARVHELRRLGGRVRPVAPAAGRTGRGDSAHRGRDRSRAPMEFLLRGAPPGGRMSDALLRLVAAVERFPRITFATGFGVEGCVILDLIGRNRLPIDVFTLDTGVLFPETLALWRRLEDRHGPPHP